jgi:hypothetical protein
MRRHPHPIEDRVFRITAGTVGGVLLASAGLAADLAREHMALLGTICGAGSAPHCAWCYAAAALALAGGAAIALAVAPRAIPQDA